MAEPVIPFDYYERLRRQTRTTSDPVTDTLASMRAEDARRTVLEAGKPDDVARVTRVAREAGENPALVDGAADEYEKALQARRFGDVAASNPAIGRWAVANPRGAAAAADDHQSLGVIGQAWAGLKEFASGVPGALEAGFQSGDKGLNDLYLSIDEAILPFTNPAGGRAILNKRAAESRVYDEQAQAARPKGGGFVVRSALQGVESIPSSLTAAAVGLVTRSPGAAATAMGITTGAPAYREALDRGLPTAQALRYAIQQGGTEALTEKIPAGVWLDALVNKSPIGKSVLRSLAQELPGEQVATAVQDLSEWVNLHPEKPLSAYLAERPEAALSTAIATVTGTSAQVGGSMIAQRGVQATGKVAGRIADTRQAKAERATIDRMAKGIEGSKLKQRDPEAFRELMREHANDAGSSHVFIPGEAVQVYMQSREDDIEWSWEWQDAAASGGDVVVPIEDFLTDVVGTPAYDALKDDIRLTQGGMSSREATEFEAAMDDLIAQASDDLAAQDKAEQANKSVREKLVDKVAAMFGESYTSPVARQYAEIAVQRAQTRAARLGMDMQGNEFDALQVRQVMPEGVAAAVKADNLDLVINAMRKGKDASYGVGPSLLEFIKQRGGINDTGGDLASMGVPKKYLRDFDPRQGAFGGVSGAGDFGVDNTLQAAISAGYFPDLAGAQDQQGPSQIDTQVLLDAIREEVSGRALYAETRVDGQRAAADELRQMLLEAGYQPGEMSDAQIREVVQRMDAESRGGGYEQEARGRIIFDQTRTLIELFQSRNLSTAIHEMGHMWLEELRFDASLPEAPEQVVADWQAVQGWFKANGIDVSDGIPVEAHELFARGIETYFMEGKAPTPTLTRIFESVRQWMISIYRTVANLKAPITPEIREVFDRMLATDEEIAAARERQGIAALFKDAAEAGMSDAEFAAYQAQADDARASSYGKVLDKAMRAIRRRETERYREARKTVKAEQTERIDASPVFRAIAAMKESRVNKEWIVDRLGLDALDLLPVRVPPLYVEGGSNPDAIAEMAGYPSGTAMIEALIGAERAHRQAKEGGDQRSMRERAIETATDEEMNRRYGDPLNDGSIEREALAAVESEMQGEVIAAEIRVLSRQTGKRPTPYALAREWARGKVRGGVWNDEASPGAIQRHARNAVKAGRAAEQALAKGDREEAYRQKQRQMLNNALLVEAKAAADEVEAAVKRMDKLARRQTMKSVDQDYLEQAQALLEAVDLRKRSQVYEKRKGGFAAWAEAQQAEGYEVVVPDSFEATLGQTNWSRMSPDAILQLDEAIKQIMHLGRLKQTLLDGQEEREWDAIFTEAEDGAGNLKSKPPADLAEPGWWDAIKSGVAGIDASLLKLETVFDWLDGGNPNGVFNRIAFRPVAEAQAREQDMLVDYYGRIKALFEKVPAETLARWDDVESPPFIDVHTGRPMRLNRKQVVAMALNVGNEGNLQRLADGYRIDPGALVAYLDETLTAQEWAFVQSVWDTIDTLWPEIEGLERRVNGVAPEKVSAREFTLGDGTVMRGGYYPAIYDTSRDYRAEENSGKESDLFEGRYTRATTRASSTKERSEQVKRPILLDLGVINRHLGETIHDITHREAVIRANRFLSSERVRRAVDNALGPAVGGQLRPWVKFVANSWASERAGNEGFGKWLGKLRANVTAVGMGLRATTMLSQIAGYSNSIEVVGEAAMAKAIAQYMRNPKQAHRFVMERSDEVRHRMDTLDRDIRSEIGRLAAANPISKAARTVLEGRKFFFHGIGYMDRLVSIPTWMAGYSNALAAGMSEADAAYAGDKAVRQSQGAGGPKDLAAIQRGTGKHGEALKLMTMFYSYFSAMYQRERSIARDLTGEDTRKPRNMPKLAARAFFLFVVPPMLTELIRYGLGADAGPDDEEWWAQWLSRKLLANAIGAIPLARDVFEPFWNASVGNRVYAPTISPVTRALESFVKAGGSMAKEARGDDAPHATKDVLEAVGYGTGLVPGQVASATQFLVDVGNGDVQPETIGDWIKGLSTGKIDD